MIPPFRRLLAALLIFPLVAQGSIVTTTVDEDDGTLGGGTGVSLREAVKYSPAATTITFAPALSGQTIRLTLGEILISQSLTIDGSALPLKITLSGDKTGNGKTSDDTRILKITTGAILLDSLILTRANSTANSQPYGGAIHVNSTTTQLTIRNSSITDNTANTLAGGIYFIGASNSPTSFLKIQNCRLTGNYTAHDGGAIHMSGTLQVEDSTFSNNTAFQGCAMFIDAGAATVERSTFTGNAAYGYGGAICNEGTFTLLNSTISGNSAPRGGGICSFSGTLTVENTTLHGNSASIYGGGVYITTGTAFVKNSTLTGNSSGDDGGGIYSLRGNLDILHATITKNAALSSRGGIFCASTSALSLNKSIVAGNTAPFAPDLPSTFTGINNLISGDPRLAPLNYYGGPTQTMPPLPGSPAIDNGSKDKGSSSLPTDQRGFPRLGPPDIGAVEYPATLDGTRIASEWNSDFDGDASPFGTEQALGTDPLVSDPANSRNITAPVLNTSGHPVLSFGIGPAAPGTRWILTRSSDLLTFTEIYRYDGSTDTAVPGVTFLRTATGVTVTDTTPPPGGVFYRFEAVLSAR